MKPRICVSVGKENLQDGLEAASAAAGKADVIEIRLDLMTEPAVSPFVNKLDTPLLFTNRAEWEGGGFTGSEETRVAFLVEAIQGEAAYVDFELLAARPYWQLLRTAAHETATKLICSWHNFDSTPPQQELIEKLKMMQEVGADIGKIVTMANDYSDALNVLNLQHTAAKLGFPLIAFCMGKPGVISRVATVALGGYMTYCALNEDETVAPGQISFKSLNDIYALIGMVKR